MDIVKHLRAGDLTVCADAADLIEAHRREGDRLRAVRDDLLAALDAFNLKEEWIISGQANSLTIRIPLAVIQQAAAARERARSTTLPSAQSGEASHGRHKPRPFPPAERR